MVMLGIGAWSAYSDRKPRMTVLLVRGTIAAAIPVFMQPRK